VEEVLVVAGEDVVEDVDVEGTLVLDVDVVDVVTSLFTTPFASN